MRGGIPGVPLSGPAMRGMRGSMRGRGMTSHRNMPPPMPPRGFPHGHGLLEHPRDFNPLPLRSSRDPYPYDDGPTPLLDRDYVPPVGNPYHGGPARRPPRLDFSSDELTLSRYSDFRRDVEDAIDSSFSQRLMRGSRPPLLVDNCAAAAAAMLEREEMAYRAGLTRGLVGAAAFNRGGPPPLFPQYQSSQSGRFKGPSGKRGSRDGRGRRARGARR